MQSRPQEARPDDGLTACRSLLGEELASVNARILELLDSEVSLISEVGHHVIGGGGKRLRPMLLLLGVRLFGYRGRQHIDLAAVIEFIHTATLLHDDVVDHSEMRRGRETANCRWGQEASVLVGDFLYSRAFQVMVDNDSMRVMQLMAEVTNSIAEGEVRQLLHRRDHKLPEAEYFHVIHSKTARLFEAAARLAAILCDRPQAEEQALGEFGNRFGIAYQLIDDLLDYLAGPAELGKNTGADLAEGKTTLPLLHALHNAPPQAAEHLRRCLAGGADPEPSEIRRILESSGSIQYTMRCAARETAAAERCLAGLPGGAARDSMAALTRWSLERRY